MGMFAKKEDPMARIMAMENRLAVVREYTDLWRQYFTFFTEREEGRKVTDADEQAFFQVMNALAANQFKFTELAHGFFKDGEAVLKVMTDTVSLQQILAMSDAQFSKTQIDWHALFIAMNKAIGRMHAALPPPDEKKGAKAAAAKKKA